MERRPQRNLTKRQCFYIAISTVIVAILWAAIYGTYNYRRNTSAERLGSCYYIAWWDEEADRPSRASSLLPASYTEVLFRAFARIEIIVLSEYYSRSRGPVDSGVLKRLPGPLEVLFTEESNPRWLPDLADSNLEKLCFLLPAEKLSDEHILLFEGTRSLRSLKCVGPGDYSNVIDAINSITSLHSVNIRGTVANLSANLDLRETFINSENGDTEIGALSKWPNLQSLVIWGSDFSETALASIGKVAPSLEEVETWAMPGEQILVILENAPDLERLKINLTTVDDSFFDYLTAKESRLSEVELNDITLSQRRLLDFKKISPIVTDEVDIADFSELGK